LISAGVQDAFKDVNSEWAYRIPFAIQWCWIPPLFIVLWFAPESPWWLARKGKIEEAEQSLNRLSDGTAIDPKEMISEILHTQMIEIEIESGTSMFDCFRGIDLRRTEIVCGIYAAQNLCGLAIGGQPTYFLEQAGISTNLSFNFTVGVLALGFVCVLICAWLMTYIGRRTLLVGGLALLTIILYIVGFIAVGSSSKTAELVEASLIFVWAVIFYLTLGPVVYAVVNEIPSMRLRAKSVSLARNAYYIVGIIINILNPYMVNNSAWGWKGKTCLFYGSTCLVCTIWAYFRLPESKGRTYEELDVLFSKKISARKFGAEDIDLYADVVAA
jgi:SP family general alpha glucoside:H+ symporter-like MFS transporter